MGFYEDELDPSFNEGDCGECGGHCGDQDCVCRTLRHIVRAQAATNNNGGDCQYGCKQSIKDLLSQLRMLEGMIRFHSFYTVKELVSRLSGKVSCKQW